LKLSYLVLIIQFTRINNVLMLNLMSVI